MSAGQLVLALLSAVLKAGLLLSLAALLSLALKRAPARTRYGVWAAALAGALLLPLLSPWVPDWSVAALPVPELTAERAAGVATTAEATADSGRAVASATPVPRRSSAALRAPDTSERTNGAAVEVSGSQAAQRSPLDRLSPAAWLLGLWLLGCVASLAWFLRALRAAGRLRRRAVPAGGPWQRELEEARRLVGLRRAVKLLISPRVMTPMTWGVFAPVILLPARAGGWSAERRRIVLLHELVHVRRADSLVRLLGRAVCSIYWPNPLAWIAARRLALEQELACDEEVVALGARPSSYAGHLLAIARSMGPAAAVPAHALDMARRSQMEGRLMSILDEKRRLRGGRKLAILALLILAGLVPALAALEPWVEDQESPAAEVDRPAATIPGGETAGVARVLGELEELARQLEPFEAELEAVDVAMEPYEAELEAIEMELEPFEAELEALESEMEPFEAQLEAMAVEMRPFEERLEAIEVALEPLAREMEQLAEQMEPLGEVGGASAELRRLNELVREMNLRMAPLHELMGATHEEMQPLHERMSPYHQRMGEQHERMAPFHRQMGEIHERMRPLHEEMGRRHEQLERELSSVVERMLARELAGLTAADTDYGVAAARIVAAASLHVEDGTLRVSSSASQLRTILGETLSPAADASEEELEAAIERFVSALGELEVQARK